MSLSAVSDSSVGADFVSRINVLGLELKVAPYLGGGRLCSKLHRGEDHRSPGHTPKNKNKNESSGVFRVHAAGLGKLLSLK